MNALANLIEPHVDNLLVLLSSAGFPSLDKPSLTARLVQCDQPDFAASLVGDDPEARRKLIGYTYQCFGLFPIRLVDRTVSANAAVAFADMVEGLHGQAALARALSTLTPVPLQQIGPVLVVGHFDPHYNFDAFLPDTLCIKVLLSFHDYAGVRQSLTQHLLPGSQPEKSVKALVAPMAFPEYLRAKGVEFTPDAASTMVRDFLRWLAMFPLLSAADEQSISAVLAREDEVTFENIPSDLRLLAYRTLTNAHVLRSDNLVIDGTIKGQLPATLVADHQLCPLVLGAQQAFLLLPEPPTFKILDDFSNRASLEIVPIIIPLHQFEAACAGQGSTEALNFAAGASATSSDRPSMEMGINEFSREDGARVINDPDQLLRFIIYNGVKARASDIHFDMVNGIYRVRYTVDGVPGNALALPGETQPVLAGRIKAYANIPLDTIGRGKGRWLASVGSREIDVRVQLMFDYLRNQRFTLRLLDKSQPIRSVASLGLSASEIRELSQAYLGNDGVIFVCGPTGAGKSTTMFAILSDLNRPDKILYSLEDPPEYSLPGVAQFHCTSDVALATKSMPTFFDGARELLRMTPNVVSIGEVRDLATAEAAILVSQSGHLAITSLHADDVFNAIVRLSSLKVNPADFASTTRMIVCQRLVRRLCRCHRFVPFTENQIDLFKSQGLEVPADARMPMAVGCSQCRHTGYYGRMVVIERLPFTDDVQDAVMRYGLGQAKISEVREVAEREGYKTLVQNALLKVLHGATTVAEVDRAVRRLAANHREVLEVTAPTQPFARAAAAA